MQKIVRYLKQLDFMLLTFTSFLAFVVAFVVTGCQSTPDSAVAPISFSNQQPILVDVASIDVTETYQPSDDQNNVERLFPTSPALAVKTWVRDRLHATGNGGRRLEVVINEASAVKTNLPRTQGVKGAFTIDQSEKYDAKLDVTINLYEEVNAIPVSDVHVKAYQSQTLKENASVAERDALFNKMTLDLINGLDKELDKNIRSYFGNYIVQ